MENCFEKPLLVPKPKNPFQLFKWPLALLPFVFCLLFSLQGAFAQGGGCNQITFNIINYEPCKFRLTYNNTTDCYTDILLTLSQGDFESFSANMPAGFSVEVFGPSQLRITHANGFLPLGNQAPLIFTLPFNLVTNAAIAYNDQCGMVGCDIFPGPVLESCPDPMDASIIGVKYRECGSLPYSNQKTIPGWLIQLFDDQGNLYAEQPTQADGRYAFYDLPLGAYLIKEAAVTGWTPNVPASGQYAVTLDASQQVVRNFGNCPSCSCDSIYMNLVQLPVNSDTCTYVLEGTMNGAYCFDYIDFSLGSGVFASITVELPASEYTLAVLDSQHVRLLLHKNKGCVPFVKIRVAGSANQQITISASYNVGNGNVACSRSFSFTCPPPPLPPPCCPAGSQFGPELVANGNFELGNQGFTNSYTYFNPGNNTMIGKYSVLDQSDVIMANSQWSALDHTAFSSSGLMLIIDGYGGPIAWQQTVNVTAGTNYAFSAWFNNLVIPTKNYDDPQVALFIDNTSIAGPLSFAEIPDQWIRLCGTWTANATGTAVLSIRVLANTDIGNDFAVDDISFRACIPQPCSVSLAVTENPAKCGEITVCTITTGPAPVSYQWCDGRTTACVTDMILPCVPTTYCVTATCSDGSTATASITYTVVDQTPPNAVCNLGVGVDLDANCKYLVTPAFVDGGSTDNCGIQSYSVSPAILMGCGVHTVTLTVTDHCGNTSTCTMGIQTIEVVPPIMTCPANVSITGVIGPNGLCSAVYQPAPAVAFDNCDPSVTVTSNAPAVFPGGTTTITWTATDDCDNVTTCTQTVTVQCACDCPNNLVDNPSFENGQMGAPNGPNQIGLCSNWQQSNNSSSVTSIGDWYSTANPYFPGYYNDVPNQFYAPLAAHCGKNYAGFDLNTCEGISSALNMTIQQGCSYKVGFWWSPQEPVTTPFTFFAIMSGANCTVYAPTGSCSHQCGGDQHVVVNVNSTHVPGTWYFHSMTVTNAYPNVQNITFAAAQSQPRVDNYIFVDDVCVQKIAEPCSVVAGIQCYPQNPSAFTSLATLGCGSAITQVDWYFDNAGPISSTNLNSILHPFNTTGWHTVCLVLTASTDGGHTICRDTVCKEVFIELPPMKCDSVLITWQKLHTVEEYCCYELQVGNLAPNCFTAIELTLSSGDFSNVVLDAGWQMNGSGNQITIRPSIGFLPTGFFSPLTLCNPGGSNPHVLDVHILYGSVDPQPYCGASFEFDCIESPLDSCCKNYDAFCQRIKDAVSITVDNAKCKATLSIGGLLGCDYIESINWGDGTIDVGNFVGGDMPMHTYAQSGTYVISWLAIEINPHTGLICFEKFFQETIVVECSDCCEDPVTFGNLIAQGFTVVQNGCSITVTAPQFDSCYFFSTPPYILGGPPVIQVVVPANGSWTFTFTQSGTYQICVSVFDDCNFKLMCTTVQIDCGPCACGTFSNLFIRPNSGPSIPVSCGGQPVLINCPPNGQPLPISGIFNCQGNCPAPTTVDWMLIQPSGTMITMTGVVAAPNFAFSIPQSLLDQSGVYCIKLVGNCGGMPCPPCLIKFQLEVPCDTCACVGFSAEQFYNSSWPQVVVNAKCNQPDQVILPCTKPDPNQLFFFHGNMTCSSAACLGSSVQWSIVEMPSGNSVAGGTVPLYQLFTGSPTGHYDITLNPAWFSPGVNYMLTVTGQCGTMVCECKVNFVFRPCPCPCSALMAQVAAGFKVKGNKFSCTRKFKPVALCPNDMVTWTITGPGGTQTFTSTGNNTIMVTFALPGIYNVCMLVKRTENGVLCQREYCRTIIVKCKANPNDNLPTITACPGGDRVKNGDFDAGLVPGHLGEGGAVENWQLFPNPGDGAAVVEDEGASDDGHVVLIGGKEHFAGIYQDLTKMNGSTAYIGLSAINYLGAGSPGNTVLEFRLQESLSDPSPQVIHKLLVDTSYTTWKMAAITVDMALNPAKHLLVVCVQNSDAAARSVVGIDNLEFCTDQMVGTTQPQQLAQIRIFPNPNAGSFQVSLPQVAGPGTIFRVTDLTGRLVLESKALAGTALQTVDARDLAAGLYFLQVVSDGKVLGVEKFVKQ